MTVLTRPAPLVEAGQPDHNACGPIALAACLDALGLPTNWTDMRTAAGGDAQGTFASQLVTAAKSRDPSVVAFETVDDPTLIVDKQIPLGRYVLLAGQCYGNAEPAPLGSTTIEHWYIVFGTGWECCNIWGGTYPTYPNLPASYVSRLGCVVLGRNKPLEADMTPAESAQLADIHAAVIGNPRPGQGDMLAALAAVTANPSVGNQAIINAVNAVGAAVAKIGTPSGGGGGLTAAQAAQLASIETALLNIEKALKGA
jgi:hypothetical protein